MRDLSTGRILRQADVLEAPRAIARGSALDDPAIRALVDQETARAHARGLQEGEARGRADVTAAATAMAGSIDHALQTAIEASAAIGDELAARVNRLAIEIAQAVVGELDPSENGLLHRVEEALRVMDDRPLTVQVHPDDLAMLEGSLPTGVEIAAAMDLGRGEARVTGRWADADLSWDAVWASVREVLDVD